MKRASYRDAVDWIARNDALGDDEGVEELRGYISVVLIADIFGADAVRVATDVKRLRDKIEKEEVAS